MLRQTFPQAPFSQSSKSVGCNNPIPTSCQYLRPSLRTASTELLSEHLAPGSRRVSMFLVRSSDWGMNVARIHDPPFKGSHTRGCKHVLISPRSLASVPVKSLRFALTLFSFLRPCAWNSVWPTLLPHLIPPSNRFGQAPYDTKLTPETLSTRPSLKTSCSNSPSVSFCPSNTIYLFRLSLSVIPVLPPVTTSCCELETDAIDWICSSKGHHWQSLLAKRFFPEQNFT